MSFETEKCVHCGFIFTRPLNSKGILFCKKQHRRDYRQIIIDRILDLIDDNLVIIKGCLDAIDNEYEEIVIIDMKDRRKGVD